MTRGSWEQIQRGFCFISLATDKEEEDPGTPVSEPRAATHQSLF
jgi:hypothetical protein